MSETEMTNAIELIDPNLLVPYPNNPKIHTDEQIERLAKIISKGRWTSPIQVDGDNVIIAGHGRRLAALKLGLKKVPALRFVVSKEEAAAMRLADNRAGEGMKYDQDMISVELNMLKSMDFDMDSIGFIDKELEMFLTEEAFTAMDNDMFVDDVGAAVDEQREANIAKEAEIDDRAAPIADALGFKRCTVAQSRELRGLMTKIETSTGKKGAEALLEHLKFSV